MAIEFLQLLIDSGVALGFNGHQHHVECVEERYRIGPSARKISVISAGSLCAGPHSLAPASPRSFNIVEIDTEVWEGRIHQRQMVNTLYNLPVWGPGHFVATGRSYLDYEICKPPFVRPSHLDKQLVLERADTLLGFGHWSEVATLLHQYRDEQPARRMLAKALSELRDSRLIMTELWPPQNDAEAVVVGGAILDGQMANAEAFIELGLIRNSTDASVREITRRINERRLR
jgi:hypothetical protein